MDLDRREKAAPRATAVRDRVVQDEVDGDAAWQAAPTHGETQLLQGRRGQLECLRPQNAQ